MDPLTALLAPFIPMAMLVIAVVAFLRVRLAKLKIVLDGWSLIAVAAIASGIVCFWMQRRLGAALDWTKLALDAPAVFILAVGGTSWIQKLREKVSTQSSQVSVVSVSPPDLEALEGLFAEAKETASPVAPTEVTITTETTTTTTEAPPAEKPVLMEPGATNDAEPPPVAP